jgi:hypothetical protein
MNEFRLFAHGTDFDPDAYLASTRLKFDGVWGTNQTSGGTRGVYKLLGDGQAIPIHEQQKIAVEYLEANRDELKALAAYPGATYFILGLQYHVQLYPGLIGFCMGPSKRLMRYALDTYYVTLDRRFEEPSDFPKYPADAPGGEQSGARRRGRGRRRR